jgi:hypothetical protein
MHAHIIITALQTASAEMDIYICTIGIVAQQPMLKLPSAVSVLIGTTC